jgi:hypothetical protein
MSIENRPLSRTRRKLLEVAALGASTAAALGCGGATSTPEPHGVTINDGGYVGRPPEEAGPDEDACCGKFEDGGMVGRPAEDGGVVGTAVGEAGPVGDMTNDAGPVGLGVNDGGEEG